MEPVDITNNTDIRIALSRIINWSSEPKSIEMRKVRKDSQVIASMISFLGCTSCYSCFT
jgi:hypothetical protein